MFYVFFKIWTRTILANAYIKRKPLVILDIGYQLIKAGLHDKSCGHGTPSNGHPFLNVQVAVQENLFKTLLGGVYMSPT